MSQNLTFQLRIAAKDETQGVLSRLRNSLARLAFKPIKIGLAGMRDVAQGLAPAIRAVARMAEAGSRLDVVGKSFRALTGKSAADAEALARNLVQAAGGTITLGKAMTLVNRAIPAGIDAARELPTILEFASKKALTTGMDVEDAMDRIIMGLSRASPQILDDFGLFANGLEDIKRSFDQIHGKDAFEQLTPAAQKAEIIRQALAEMQTQMRGIGVSGKETAFAFQRMRSSIQNITDTFGKLIANFKLLQDGLRQWGNIIPAFFEKLQAAPNALEAFKFMGGLIIDFFADVGEGIGRAIAAGVMSGIQFISPKLAEWLGINEKKILEMQAGSGMKRTFARLGLDEQGNPIKPPGAAGGGGGKLSDAERRRVKGELEQVKREERKTKGDTDLSIRRKAAAEADEHIRARRAKGEAVPPGERDRLIAEIRKKKTDQELKRLGEQRKTLEDRLAGKGVGPPAPPGVGPELVPPFDGQRENPKAAAARARRAERIARRKADMEDRKQHPFKQQERVNEKARKQIERLPDQIADDIDRLISGQRAGGGRMTAEEMAQLEKSVRIRMGWLEKAMRDSGMERAGVGIDQLGVRGGRERLGDTLNRFKGSRPPGATEAIERIRRGSQERAFGGARGNAEEFRGAQDNLDRRAGQLRRQADEADINAERAGRAGKPDVAERLREIGNAIRGEVAEVRKRADDMSGKIDRWITRMETMVNQVNRELFGAGMRIQKAG